MESGEAPDDSTFVLYFKGPYYRAESLGPRAFWIHPQHLLGDAYQKFQASKDANDLLNLPYWTSEYVHLGPFRLTEFDPGEGLTFEAYDGYFLGRPRLDVVRVRFFGNENALFSNVMAGSVDIVLDLALRSEMGFELKDRWERAGQGTVFTYYGYTRFLEPQWRPSFQREPGNLDPRARAALYHALDREALADAIQAGHPELAAFSLLPPIERSHAATKDGLRQFTYDADRARSLFREAGWTAGPDGALRHATEGRPYRTTLWTTPGGEQEIAAIAAYWRQVGVEVEENTVSPAQTRDNEFRASFPGWETTASFGDSILNFLQGPAASPQTRWTGNRAGYDDPQMQRLLATYYASLTDTAEAQAAKALSDQVAAELPILPIYYEADHLTVRKGIAALSDSAGGAGAGALYGTFTRNAHLWDVAAGSNRQ
jgi:peptide/nickel transport system substrate-binding protein